MAKHYYEKNVEVTGATESHRRKKGHYPPWFNETIIFVLKEKEKARKKYKKTGTSFHLEQFKIFRRNYKKLIRTAYSKFIEEIQGNMISNTLGSCSV